VTILARARCPAGNALYDAALGVWHGYFTEIAGRSCGLSQWKNQSTVVHATAPTPAGPFTKQAVVVGHEAHNPQAVEIAGQYYLFHIGSGNRPEPVADCDPTSVDPVPAPRAQPARKPRKPRPGCKDFHGVDNCLQAGAMRVLPP